MFDDIALLLEQFAAVRIGDKERSLQLRHRYLALFLEAIRAPADFTLARLTAELGGGRRALGRLAQLRMKVRLEGHYLKALSDELSQALVSSVLG